MSKRHHNRLNSTAQHPDSDFVPAYEDVQKKAYQLHEEKGGSEFDNWLEAERILKEEHRLQR